MDLDFFGMIFLIYEHSLSQVSSKSHFNLSGIFCLLKRKFFMIPQQNPLNVSIYFVKSFLKYHSFQETRASSTIYSETNRAEKIILNIFGVAILKKLKSHMVLGAQEKNLVSSHFEV